MTLERLEAILREAIVEGILPVTAANPEIDSRPWPVVLLVGLGAWLATIPLLIAVALLLGDVISRGAGPYIVGLLLLAGAIVVFRVRNLPVFVEQLALPLLLAGGGAMGFGLYRDMPMQGASMTLGLLALVSGVAVERAWLRVLLGAAAAVFATLSCVTDRAINLDRNALPQFWMAWHLSFAYWLVGRWLQRSVFDHAGKPVSGAAIESIAAGWLLATLTGFAWFAGMTFLVGATFEQDMASDIARATSARQGAGGTAELLQQVVSVALALGAIAWSARSWPSLRQPWCAGVAAVLLGLAWCMPVLGAVLLALILCATTQRWLQAGAASVAAAWIIGAFYYQVRYPLGEKALLLVAAGAVLGALAWSAQRNDGVTRAADSGVPVPALPAAQFRLWAGVVVTVFLTLAVANIGIWQKEEVIAHGRPVYVELAPVDPRSLLQGDYMRLNFRLPDEVRNAPDRLLAIGRPHLIARRDARGVAVPLRIEQPDAALGPDELRIELTPAHGEWMLVTDAWYFSEGDAGRWARAKYGEFRVAADGQALLVGMADAELRPLQLAD